MMIEDSLKEYRIKIQQDIDRIDSIHKGLLDVADQIDEILDGRKK